MHSIDPLIPRHEPSADRLDIFAVKDRLHALFSRYGQVQRLDLVRADEGQAQRVMCFLRMSRPEDEQAVGQALGMGRFGGDLVMVVALDNEAAPPWPARPEGPGLTAYQSARIPCSSSGIHSATSTACRPSPRPA